MVEARATTHSNPRSALLSATVILLVAALIGKAITFVRDVVIARQYGASAAVDFVLLAQLMPVFLVGVVSNGVVLRLPSVFRATAERYGETAGIVAADRFTHRLLAIEAAALLGTGVVISTLPPLWHMRGAILPPVLMLLLCVQALLDSAIALYAQTLQIMGRFRRAAFPYAANGLVTLAIVTVFAPRIGIWAWPVGLLVDSTWQVAFLRAAVPPRAAHLVEPPGSHMQALRTATPSIALFALTLVFAVSDRTAGLLAGTGTLALWTWALRMGSAVTGFASLPVATAVFSRGHVTGKQEPRYQGAAWLVAVGFGGVATLGFVVAGRHVIDLAFGSGRFSHEDLTRLFRLTTFAFLAVVPTAMFTVSSRALMSRGEFQAPIAAFASGGVIYPVIIAITFPVFSYASLGVSYVAASLLSGCLCTYFAIRRGVLAFGRLAQPAHSP